MRVVAVIVQELREAGVIRAAIFLEQRRADLRSLDLEEGVLIAQAFAAGAVIGAEPRVDLDGVTSVGTVPASVARTQS
jgi:hypothetical protein